MNAVAPSQMQKSLNSIEFAQVKQNGSKSLTRGNDGVNARSKDRLPEIAHNNIVKGAAT